ncbi:MAG: ABC transporter substrate-binding protein [Endozoicomonas sp.]
MFKGFPSGLFFLAATFALPLSAAASAGQVEVLHWWTSPGEKAAVGILEELVNSHGQEWKDFAVAGGGGGNAMTVLKSRVISGNPPSAAQIRGVGIQEWGGLGLLTSIDDLAKAEQWDELLPEVVSSTMKYKGRYVAAPVNIHRTNWLWVNPEAFRKTGVEIPDSWEGILAIAPKLRKAGYIPLAHGGAPWQASTIFESVVLATGGADFYQDAFVDRKPEAIKSETMARVFKTMADIRTLFDEGSAWRDWDQATGLVIEGRAAMQLMGDWAKGEFVRKGRQSGKDYLCLPAPGTRNSFIYNIDSFVMFNLPDDSDRRAQKILAKLLMDPYFQLRFNQLKGSIPARKDVPTEMLDDCGQQSRRALEASVKKGTLVPGITHGMVVGESYQNAVIKVVSQFLNSQETDIKSTLEKLAVALGARS